MNPEQLWETTMNPETRTLTQITIGDAELLAEVMENLLGDDSEPRKELLRDALANIELESLDL